MCSIHRKMLVKLIKIIHIWYEETDKPPALITWPCHVSEIITTWNIWYHQGHSGLVLCKKNHTKFYKLIQIDVIKIYWNQTNLKVNDIWNYQFILNRNFWYSKLHKLIPPFLWQVQLTFKWNFSRIVPITNWGPVTHICLSKLSHHLFR